MSPLFNFHKQIFFWTASVLLIGFFIPFFVFHLAGNFSNHEGIRILPEKEVNSAKEEKQKRNIPLASITESVGEKQASNKNIVSLIFVGDIMVGRGVENSVIKNGNGDYAFLFKDSDFIKNADISFGNLEGPISDTGKDLENLYSFRFNPLISGALKDSGFDVLSIANNHIGDWGRGAFEDNFLRLIDDGFLVVGGGVNKENASSVKIIGKQGIRFGFLAFSDVGPNWLEAGENNSGILIAKDELVSYLVQSASQRADVLIVSFHFGKEYQKNADDRQKKLARLAIDSGAKIVVGHHPHVVQEIENYKNGIIAYSLGNFIFDQNFSDEKMQGLALEIIFDGAEIISVNQNKIEINEFFQPQLAD